MILLASGSPRRRQLLEELGLEFRMAQLEEVDESFDLEEVGGADNVAAHLSERKSMAYRGDLTENDILLTADTVVIIDGQVLGKPQDRAEAIEMLTTLSGNTHKVITGITLRTLNTTNTVSALTLVTFRELQESEIEWYVDNYKPFDKAGSYGAQEWMGLAAIESYNGEYTNVVGLPTTTLIKELNKLNNLR